MTLKDIDFSIAMYGTTPISQSTYEVGYTGDESSINVKFTITDEPELTGATAIVHLYFSDSSHIVRDLVLEGVVFSYTLVGTENDHAGVVRADVIITKGGAKYTRAGHRFRIDASLEAAAPLVEYAVDTLDTLVEGAEGWLLQAQTDFGAAQSQRAAEWVTDNDTRDVEFDADQASRASTFGASETERTSTFNTNETSRSNTFTTNENARQAAADSGEMERDASYTDAEANRDSQFTATEAIRSDQEAGRVSAESARVTAEAARVTEYNTLADDLVATLNAADANIEEFDIALQTGIVATNIETKLTELETTYAPELVSLGEQLEQAATKAELSAIATPKAVTLLAQMTDVTNIYVYTGVEGGYTAGNWYYHDGTAWVSGGVYQATAIGDGSVTDLKLAATGIKSSFADRVYKNVYNPALSTDGKTFAYGTGLYQTLETEAISGKTPVLPGTSFTMSMPSTEQGFGNIGCYDAAGVYLGMSKVLSENPVAAGVTDTTQAIINGRWQRVLTFASDTQVRFIEFELYKDWTTHTTDDFNRIRYSVQVEQGSVFTSFEAYGSAPIKLNETSMPSGYNMTVLKQTLNPLYQKSALFIGDSICKALNTSGGYAAYVAAKNEMTVTNAGVGGASLSQIAGRTNICTTIDTFGADYDYIVIEGGINDVLNSAPLGDKTAGFSDIYDVTTISGALEYIIRAAQIKWKGKKIIFIFTHRLSTSWLTPQTAFVNKAKEILNKWSVPFIDIFNESALNSGIAELNTYYFLNEDKLHPNDIGYNVGYNQKVDSGMKSL